ncbi:MAG: hypothetical protein RLZZ630_578 [Bacteroidota bacterium]|jgi:uncharacterized protein
METVAPVQQGERAIIVDIVRGFALTGVLFANITAYSDQNMPAAMLAAMSSPLDDFLATFAKLFIEWKFMTIFSILFGYGFGLILASLEKKNINPAPFFARRMLWLFVFGIIHALMWWGDVLHFYALTGLILFACRKLKTPQLLTASILFMFIIPPVISFLFRDHTSFFNDDNMKTLYTHYKFGNLGDVLVYNLQLNYRAFVLTGLDVHDICLTLGRFFFGYYLLRIGLFDGIENKKSLFRKFMFIGAPVTITYMIFRWYTLKPDFSMNQFILEPLLGIGIFSTACFYVCTLVWLYLHQGSTWVFRALQALGKMTLSNYLLVSVASITLFYGIGFGKLGETPMRIVWIFACCCLFVEVVFSTYWLNRFQYGPMEWVWRQLTYNKRIRLKK